jgi:hypothetical protein
MSEFTEKDHAMAEKNKHISDDEIRQDIADTRAEIVTLEREIHGLRIINDRMSNFRADAKESGIKERKIL